MGWPGPLALNRKNLKSHKHSVNGSCSPRCARPPAIRLLSPMASVAASKSCRTQIVSRSTWLKCCNWHCGSRRRPDAESGCKAAWGAKRREGKTSVVPPPARRMQRRCPGTSRWVMDARAVAGRPLPVPATGFPQIGGEQPREEIVSGTGGDKDQIAHCGDYRAKNNLIPWPGR